MCRTLRPAGGDATARGMRTLRQDGGLKVLSGMTTIEEVMMITAEESM